MGAGYGEGMMSFAFMPLYTGDYLRDTQHLSMSEHGAYFRLLMFCWDQRGPAPLDERRLCGICNARSGDEIEAMRRVLAEFFVRMEDGYYNKRIEEELDVARSMYNKAVERGRRSAEARRAKYGTAQPEGILKGSRKDLETLSRSSGNTLEPTTTTTTTIKEKNITPIPSLSPSGQGGSARQASLVRFNEFWAAYPKKVAKPQCMAKWKSKGCEDIADRVLAALERQKRTWADPQFVPNPLTWLNQERWDAELPLAKKTQSVDLSDFEQMFVGSKS